VNNVAGAIAGPFVLVIVAGVLFVVMLVGVVPVFAMMLLVVSKFVEAKCWVWLMAWPIYYTAVRKPEGRIAAPQSAETVVKAQGRSKSQRQVGTAGACHATHTRTAGVSQGNKAPQKWEGQ
jgi:hypothetical protein